ncbi:hypothetical protein F2Q68_00046274 [Brassica cretica]|uniref:Uncharacterized protein n=1 Tax=Brassica cretica TaxID=69181 RepID=A0A8S9LQR4_BRACR|nr:hypothetical protein F2Q68_00046274 [Brassica cretica]
MGLCFANTPLSPSDISKWALEHSAGFWSKLAEVRTIMKKAPGRLGLTQALMD